MFKHDPPVYPNAGFRRLVIPFEPRRQSFQTKHGKVLAWLHWPRKAYRFLNIEVEAPAEASLPRVKFFSTTSERDPAVAKQRLDHLLTQVGRPANTIESRFRSENHWAAEVVAPQQALQISVTVNTDHAEFIKLVQDTRQQRGLPHTAPADIELSLPLYYYDAQDLDRQTISLKLHPLTALPLFSGYLSLDLGNTSSTFCSLRAAAGSLGIEVMPDVAYDYQISDKQLSRADNTVPSYLRIENLPDLNQIEPDDRDRYLQDARLVRWEIGANALPDRQDVTGLIIGPKRILARHALVKSRSRAASPIPISTYEIAKGTQIQVDVSPLFPAELYITRLLQNFRAITLQHPTALAVTYPTTFSQQEVAGLCEAVRRAWRRQEKAEPVARPNPEVVPLLDLDEASAGAFHMIARRFLELPGALQSFRYLYPDGFHMLVYDCGGGTTDIALVQALAPTPKTLEVRVLGRSGVRDLGGDDVTEAVFKVLKYRLAEKILQNRSGASSLKSLPNCEQDPAAFRKMLDVNGETWQQVDKLVPTIFEPRSLLTKDALAQRNAFFIWQWAEEFKRHFSRKSKRFGMPLPAFCEPLWKALAETNQIKDATLMRDMMASVDVGAQEIVCQIQDEVEASLRCCNALILKKLHGIEPERLKCHHDSDEADSLPKAIAPVQIDCVSVVGNASRFPYIQEALRDGLKIPFLNEVIDQQSAAEKRPPALEGDKFHFESGQLKTAVAHGAALALYYECSVDAQMKARFPMDFKKLLPFTAGYIDRSQNAKVRLFEEGTPYAELEPRTIECVEVETEGETEAASRMNSLALVMRWPGADEWLPLGHFHFDRPVEGAVTVEYDTDCHQFKACSNGGEEVWMQADIDETVFLSPVQRGKL